MSHVAGDGRQTRRRAAKRIGDRGDGQRPSTSAADCSSDTALAEGKGRSVSEPCLDHICDMSRQLKSLATRAGYLQLALILEMAELEAADRIAQLRCALPQR